MLIRDLGILAAAAYESTTPKSLVAIGRHNASSSLNGFQAVAFSVGDGIVVAFRGTEQQVDKGVDLMLGLGMNTSYFALGESFAAQYKGKGDVMLCGHSLGGAIAQVVANRLELPMVTFNAPGVGVLASREIASASPTLTAVRTVGMLASAVLEPRQAFRDMKSAFNKVRGLNICLEGDIVSRYGLHYGEVARIPGLSLNPASEHRMATVNKVLQSNALGAKPAVFN